MFMKVKIYGGHALVNLNNIRTIKPSAGGETAFIYFDSIDDLHVKHSFAELERMISLEDQG